MLSKKDIAIKELCERDNLDTFFNQVLIDNDNLDQDFHCDACYKIELYRTCHIWQGQETVGGYGHWNAYSKTLGTRINVRVHRLAYAIEYGFDELPKGKSGGYSDSLVLNHLCFNRLCVNPRHLEVITSKENTSVNKRKPRKPNDAIIADNLEDFMEQIRNTERE
jgi:hypothetical protein